MADTDTDAKVNKDAKAKARSDRASLAALRVLTGFPDEEPELRKELREVLGPGGFQPDDHSPATVADVARLAAHVVARTREYGKVMDEVLSGQEILGERMDDLATQVKTIPDAIKTGQKQAEDNLAGTVQQLSGTVGQLGGHVEALQAQVARAEAERKEPSALAKWWSGLSAKTRGGLIVAGGSFMSAAFLPHNTSAYKLLKEFVKLLAQAVAGG